MSATYHGHGWVHDGSEWYPDHDTGPVAVPTFLEVWAPGAMPVSLKEFTYRHEYRSGPLTGMLWAKWDPDYSEWTWPEDLTFSQG